MILALKKRIGILFIFVLGLTGATAAGSLSDINVVNAQYQATVSVTFTGQPEYTFALLHKPERVILDVKQNSKVSGLPLTFSGKNLVKNIRNSTSNDPKKVRLVFELTHPSTVKTRTHQKGKNYFVIFTVTAEINKANQRAESKGTPRRAMAPSFQAAPILSRSDAPVLKNRGQTVQKNRAKEASSLQSIVVAIDAGHGGQDPGAIGQNGLQEKEVTLAIARRLQRLLTTEPMFKPVLTRTGDYFISVMGRSDVARKQRANVLISIHADAAPNRNAKGASVWVLSNRRANSEMAGWLEQHEKQSELLGGAGDLLANNQTDPYLSKAVLDLQFGHSQRVGYDVAVNVLQQLQKVGVLHKHRPEHASLGVLRSPDIPSLLIETGFISNSVEEWLLGSGAYQEKIAQAIYNGLRSYFLTHPLQESPNTGQTRRKAVVTPLSGADFKSEAHRTPKENVNETQTHTVKRGETLSSIAEYYGTNLNVLRTLNVLANDKVWIGQRLSVPKNNKARWGVKQNPTSKEARWHIVVRGDTLSSIAARYGVSISELKRINNLKSDVAPLERKLTIPLARSE